jgi:hypothetical protein
MDGRAHHAAGAAVMPLKLVKGKFRRVPVEATPSLEHRIDRLYTIAMNFNERFIAIETALAKLTAPAIKSTRVRKPSQKSADNIG